MQMELRTRPEPLGSSPISRRVFSSFLRRLLSSWLSWKPSSWKRSRSFCRSTIPSYSAWASASAT